MISNKLDKDKQIRNDLPGLYSEELRMLPQSHWKEQQILFII